MIGRVSMNLKIKILKNTITPVQKYKNRVGGKIRITVFNEEGD